MTDLKKKFNGNSQDIKEATERLFAKYKEKPELTCGGAHILKSLHESEIAANRAIANHVMTTIKLLQIAKREVTGETLDGNTIKEAVHVASACYPLNSHLTQRSQDLVASSWKHGAQLADRQNVQGSQPARLIPLLMELSHI